MLRTNNTLSESQKEKMYEFAIESIEEMISDTAAMAGGITTLEETSRAGVLPFDEDIFNACKDLFSRINRLLCIQKAQLEHGTLMGLSIEAGSEQAKKLIAKARTLSPFSAVAQS